MTSPFPFLQRNIKVTPLEDDQVQVTVTLPSSHFLHFVRLLDALSGFVSVINNRYTSRGLDRPAAIKQISADLRKAKHYWSSIDLVRFALNAAGRPGRQGRPRRHFFVR